MFDEPGSATQFSIKDHMGSLLLIAVNGYMSQFPTSFGLRDVIRGEIAVVDGPQADARYGDAMIFSSKMVPQLKGSMGRVVLGRVAQGQPRPGQNAPYVLEKPTPEDAKLANAWVERNGAIEAHVVSPDQWQAQPQAQPQPRQHGQAAQGWSGGSYPQGQQPQGQQQWNQPPQGQPSFAQSPAQYPGGTYTQPPAGDDQPPF